MKKVFLLALTAAGALLISSCEKCYRCHNVCAVCTEQHYDTTLTITVCSDIFGEEHYREYLDSLTSPALGWVCTEGSANRTKRFCGTKSGNNAELIHQKEQGWICAPE